KLRNSLDKNALADELRRTSTIHKDFLDDMVDDVLQGRGTGSTTLIAGMVHASVYPDTQEPCECITMVQIGDGGYVVIGPYPRRDTSVYGGFMRPGQAPAQIDPGSGKNVPTEAIQARRVMLRKGEMLLAMSDGIEKGVYKTL